MTVLTETKLLLLFIILLCLAACQANTAQNETGVLPTRAIIPSPTASSTPIATATALFTATSSATITDTPTATPSATATATMTATASNTPIIIPTLATFTTIEAATPTPRLATVPEHFIFGSSTLGNDLVARRIGNGQTKIMLVGGIHGGWEANTVTLVEAIRAHFESVPQNVLPGISLIFIPALNPDGVALGQTLAGRFNANGVDLNRNWGCGWESVAYFRDQQVNPGSAAFSEPETLLLASLIKDVRPTVVLFYHSAAAGVFTGNCGGPSPEIAPILGNATGYSYGQPFTEYAVSGTASSWVDGEGIYSADVELATTTDPEFDRNLRGVMALQCWLVGAAAADLPVCDG